jgi:hypothetical protein
MKAVLFAVGVLGLAAVFGLCEPTPAAGTPVTSDDVRLVAEQMSEQDPGSTCVVRVRGKGKGGYARGYGR